MAKLLIEHLEAYFQKNPRCKKPSSWEDRSSKSYGKSVSKYLNKKQSKGLTCWGFYLDTNENQLMTSRQRSFVQKSRKNSSPEMLLFLDLGGYQWINSKTQQHLIVEAGKYNTFSKMVYDLIQLSPLEDRPTNWENPLNSQSLVNQSVINKFRDVFTGYRKNGYRGWTLQRLD